MKFKFSFYYNICTYDINALSSSTHIMFANSNQVFLQGENNDFINRNSFLRIEVRNMYMYIFVHDKHTCVSKFQH